MNLIELLRTAEIEDLGLPLQIVKKLRDQNQTEVQKIYAAVQSYRAFGKCSLIGLDDSEMEMLNQHFTDLFVAKGLMKGKTPPGRPVIKTTSSSPISANRNTTTKVTKRTTSTTKLPKEKKNPVNIHSSQPVNRSTVALDPSLIGQAQTPQSPLAIWESRLAPQLRKVELVGEIQISKEELDDISQRLSHLFKNHSDQAVLEAIERHCPATFLVFMVGQGVHGYNCGEFWPAYEQALHMEIDHSAFGKLFEKLLQHFDKPQFCDLQERSMRYMSLILAHGGIPVYCLKDFFSNIVLNGAIRPQFFALEGEELIDEILKHTTYTANTDKPVLYFLEYGGKMAANLLDRSRKMLLAWQQSQTLLSAEEAGLPAHLTQYFSEWTRDNAILSVERGSRNRLKRPQLSLDPWGLGIFLLLPSQPISALSMSNLAWKVEAGTYQEKIKARTQRKGDQTETREIILRLNEVPENIQVQFSQGENEFDWKINGYSPERLILAFDPTTGHIQNHILARETWLLYPNHFSLSILSGEGNLLEVLPDLPGEWAKFKLECWDLSQTSHLGLKEKDKVSFEIHVRSQEKIPLPTLDGGRTVPTDLEEDPTPVYAGTPPLLRIPLSHYEDLQSELNRWQIRINCVGTADPEISYEASLANLPGTICTVLNNTAVIHLGTPQLLDTRPTGTYQITIKGPLGRDATLSFQILPECEVTGMKSLYIPGRGRGPEDVHFSVQTSLLNGLDSMNGADGIKVETGKSGLHHILVPAEISSVGLLVRQETISHQFIRVPIYFRIKRLRWRLVGDNGLVENWMQKHSTLSVQELLQQGSPLLIVDLPENDDGNMTLQLNLLDIQGNIIQQLNPTEHSAQRTNRFWRFDLSRIKHSMDINDSPIFRVDLVGIKDEKGEDEFSLPVLVFTREIQVSQLATEVYSSSDQYHVLVTWQEDKQLRSRALILWSLFRPWQTPIIEAIPDAACGEYEFVISNNGYIEGIYRLQMVVIDPWAPSPPPLLPPDVDTPGCHDVKLSSADACLLKIKQGISAANHHKNNQFSNHIEASLILHYLGEKEASYQDLEMCCRNLMPATSREILTLRSILAQANSTNLENEFGSQMILPEVLSRLYKDMLTSEITQLEFTSILELAPHSKKWPAPACEILVQLEDPKIRFRALVQLVSKDTGRAVTWIILLLRQSSLSVEDAVELLYDEKPSAIEQLRTQKEDPIAKQLMELLGRYNLLSGLPVVRVGSWVLTNAGWGRIDEILDPSTRISTDSFLEGDGKYILSVTLHIYESHDLTGEIALINMATSEITFPRANRLFICKHCEEFATASQILFKKHMNGIHEKAIDYSGDRKNIIPLTSMQFNMNPQQKTKEL